MAQFTEDEARQIFARAAKHQHAADDEAPGLSVEEIEEIGKAAGLSPQHIATAVAEVRSGGADVDAGGVVMGIETDVRRSRLIPGELTDEMWEGIVSRLRQTFKVQGITADVGSTREWTGTNSMGGLSNLHVVARPGEAGTTITLHTWRTEEVQSARWLPAIFIAMALFIPLFGVFTGNLGHPAIWIFTAIVAALGGLGTLSTHQGYKRWSERRQREFDTLLDQFELAARSASTSDLSTSAASPAPSSEPLGQVLDALPTAPENAPDATRSRTRA